MTDQELLAYERERHGKPYMTLAKAKEMQRVALQFWHLGSGQEEGGPAASAALRGRATPLTGLGALGARHLSEQAGQVVGRRSGSRTPTATSSYGS
jgi:hypothetical protein